MDPSVVAVVDIGGAAASQDCHERSLTFLVMGAG